MTDSLRDRIAQTIWQEWVVNVGRSMPEGMADKLADAVIEALKLHRDEELDEYGNIASGDDVGLGWTVVTPPRPMIVGVGIEELTAQFWGPPEQHPAPGPVVGRGQVETAGVCDYPTVIRTRQPDATAKSPNGQPMTDNLRDRIAAVLSEHVEDQLTNYDAERNECGCGHQGDATYREHVADAVIRELGSHGWLIDPESSGRARAVKPSLLGQHLAVGDDGPIMLNISPKADDD